MLTVFAFFDNAIFADREQHLQIVSDLQTQAKSGDAGAQFLLGFMYAEGQGVAKDPQEALKWYTMSANQDHTDAQQMLGMMYAEGQGITKNRQEAIEWYTKVAEQGNANVQVILAMLLVEDVQPSVADFIEAYKWILIAEMNHEDVASHKAWLAERMAAEQITESHKRADRYVRQSPTSVNNQSGSYTSFKHILQRDGFLQIFPSPPQRTIVRDNERLLTIHYQSILEDDQVQYNVSFQYFKNNKPLDEAAQKIFIKDYLIGRAMFAWKNKIQKIETTILGFNATRFKHTIHSAGIETIHEGLVFIANGDFISLTCVYAADKTPVPSFDDFLGAFVALSSKPTDPNGF